MSCVPAALAADLVFDAPVAEAAANVDWNGFYLGVHGGLAGGSAVSVGTVNGLTDTAQLGGGLLGLTAGYNAQMDNFVLGIEGDIAWSGVAGSSPCTVDPTLTCGGSVDWLGTVRGRAGFAVDSVLLYATAGVAVAGVTATVSPAVPFTTGTHTDTYLGWTAGVGAELAVADNISLKAEYAFVNLGTRQAPLGSLGTTNAFNISPYLHTVKVGANIGF